MPRLVEVGASVLICLSCSNTSGQHHGVKCPDNQYANSQLGDPDLEKPDAPERQSGEWLYVEPVRFYNADDDAYRATVAKVFASDDHVGSCFQMVSLIDGEPEEIVFAQCGGSKAGAEVQLVHLVASESIWDKVRTSGISGAQGIKTRRSESRLASEDARLLHRLWSQVLARTRVETGARLRETRRDYFFSTFREGLFQGRIGGVAKNPPAGSVSAELVEIGRLLSRVADSESERDGNLALLRAAVGRILQRPELSGRH